MKRIFFLIVLLLSACATSQKVGIVAERPPAPVVVVVAMPVQVSIDMPAEPEKPFRHVAHYADFPDGGYPAAVENDVIVGNGLPDWMETCTDADVYGNPYGLNEPFYTVKAGETVRIHDISHDNTWVMVASARWIPLDALCWNNE